MKITFNTSQPQAASAEFYLNAFKGDPDISLMDQNYSNYDVALFMTYDHEFIPSIKQSHPHLKIGILDPRNHKVAPSVESCDFIIIDSIEMEDYWRRSNIPIFRYAEYPSLPPIEKIHSEDDFTRLGYHGNKIHLQCMSQNVTPALEELGENYKLKLLVMYNGSSPQPSESWYPKNIDVEFCKWSYGSYETFLPLADIGLVPNNLIHDEGHKTRSQTSENFNYSPDDYSLRFKMPSNPGRIIVFGLMGIPVIADFFPSALQYLQNGSGMVAHSKDGWKYCMEELIKDRLLRESMGSNLKSLVKNRFDFKIQNRDLKNFLFHILKK